MPKCLTDEARILLNQIVHSSDPNWWNIVEDKVARPAALDELLRFELIEVDRTKGVRATEFDIKSNQKAKAHNLV